MEFSAAPLTVLALDYSVVSLSWAIPSGNIDWFRVVRNQAHYPENQEDGVILVDTTALGANYNSFLDGITPAFKSIPLIQGQFAHYSIWVRKTADGSWVEAARNNCLVPKDHGDTFSYNGSDLQDSTTHDKIMELIPRVFTSTTLSPLDEVDPDSTLYKFMKAFSFTVDEMLTYADLAVPNTDISITPPSMLKTRLQHYGIDFADNLPDSSYRALIRDAIYMYSNKGTTTGLLTFLENLTGYNVTITGSPNLMPSIESATFNGGPDVTGSFDMGGWTSTNSYLSYTNSTDIPNTEPYSQGVSGRIQVAVPPVSVITGITRTSGSHEVKVYVSGHGLLPGYTFTISGVDSTMNTPSGQVYTVIFSGSSYITFNTTSTTSYSSFGLTGTLTPTEARLNLTNDPFVNSFSAQPAAEYTLSAYMKASSSHYVYPIVTWYDQFGKIMGTEQISSSKTVGTSWSRIVGDVVQAPYANYVVTASEYTNTVVSGQTQYVFTIPDGHSFYTGDKVYLTSVPSGDGIYTVTARTLYTLTVLGGIPVTASSGSVPCTLDIAPVSVVTYGTVSFKFSANSMYYIDLIQISETISANIVNAQVSGSSGNQTITFTMDYYDQWGAIQIGDSVTVTGIVDSGSANKFNVTNATIVSLGSGTFTVNATGFSQTYVSGGRAKIYKGYHEPNGIYAYMAPNKINYIKNPSFETTPTASGSKNSWYFTNEGTSTIVSDSPTFVLRDYSCRITPAAGANLDMNTFTENGVIPPGQWYTFSVYLKTTSATPATNLELYMTAVDSTVSLTINSASSTTVPITGATVSGTSGSGKTITFIANNSFTVGQTVRTTDVVESGGGSHFNFTSATIIAATSTTFTIGDVTGFAQTYISGGFATSNFLVLSSDWTRYSTSIFLPVQYNFIPLNILGTKITVGIRSYSLNAATTILVDGAQLEAGFVATDYFDGSYSTIGGSWSNNARPDNSYSYLYINKPIKVKALQDYIEDFIPKNAAYAVTSVAGVEVLGIA
jgi:hypothetical protein